MQLGNNIRRLRFDNDEMSQEDLALAAGVTRQTIHSIEKGKFIPSALLAIKIAKVFGKNFEEVFFLIDNDDRA
jgi:putative transcriptional regulator